MRRSLRQRRWRAAPHDVGALGDRRRGCRCLLGRDDGGGIAAGDVHPGRV